MSRRRARRRFGRWMVEWIQNERCWMVVWFFRHPSILLACLLLCNGIESQAAVQWLTRMDGWWIGECESIACLSGSWWWWWCFWCWPRITSCGRRRRKLLVHKSFSLALSPSSSESRAWMTVMKSWLITSSYTTNTHTVSILPYPSLLWWYGKSLGASRQSTAGCWVRIDIIYPRGVYN